MLSTNTILSSIHEMRFFQAFILGPKQETAIQLQSRATDDGSNTVESNLMIELIGNKAKGESKLKGTVSTVCTPLFNQRKLRKLMVSIYSLTSLNCSPSEYPSVKKCDKCDLNSGYKFKFMRKWLIYRFTSTSWRIALLFSYAFNVRWSCSWQWNEWKKTNTKYYPYGVKICRLDPLSTFNNAHWLCHAFFIVQSSALWVFWTLAYINSYAQYLRTSEIPGLSTLIW